MFFSISSQRKVTHFVKALTMKSLFNLFLCYRGGHFVFLGPPPCVFTLVWLILSLFFGVVMEDKNRIISWQPQQPHFSRTQLLGARGSSCTQEVTWHCHPRGASGLWQKPTTPSSMLHPPCAERNGISLSYLACCQWVVIYYGPFKIKYEHKGN